MPRLDSAYSIRACDGDNARGEWPATLQSRATYSSANTITAVTSMAVNSQPNFASYSGRRPAPSPAHPRMTMATISRTKREPTE